jgi:hypothetical protein
MATTSCPPPMVAEQSSMALAAGGWPNRVSDLNDELTRMFFFEE